MTSVQNFQRILLERKNEITFDMARDEFFLVLNTIGEKQEDKLAKLEALLQHSPALANVFVFTNETVLLDRVKADDRLTCRLLLQHGADPNIYWSPPNNQPHLANCDTYTPLIHTAWKGRFDIAKELIAYGADVNAASKQGWTPLMYAAENMSDHMLAVLVKASTLSDLRNDKGQTARDILQEKMDEFQQKNGTLESFIRVEECWTSMELIEEHTRLYRQQEAEKTVRAVYNGIEKDLPTGKRLALRKPKL